MQVLSLSRRALGCAALLSPGAILLGAPHAGSAQTAPAVIAPFTMTVDSPLARPEASGDNSDPRFQNGIGPDGKRARPLSLVTRFGRWFPVAVNLSNTGDDTDVTLSMRLGSSVDPSSVGSVSTFETHVELPRNSSKRVWIYGRLERGACDMGEISMVGRGVANMSRAFAISSPQGGARVVWTVSDKDENLASTISNLPQLRVQSPNSGPSYGQYRQAYSGRAVEALGSGHDMVPSRWIGLDSVDLVVLHDFAHKELSAEQAEALRGYVAGGGSMLVLGGSNTARLAASPLSEMFPVAPSGSREASTQERGALVSLLQSEMHRVVGVKRNGVPVDLPTNLSGPRTLTGADRLGGAPVMMATGDVSSDARALAKGVPTAMASVRRFGAGRVEWLAFDPTVAPFVGWRGQEALWKPIVSKLSQPRRIADVDARLESQGETSPNDYSYSYSSSAQTNDSLFSNLRAALSRSPQLRTPAASSIAWFLALYVFFLVPVNYVVLRKLDRRELAWITVPVIVLAFSTLSYAAAVRIKGTQLRARQVAVVQGSDASPLARADSMLWVFSPRKATYSIEGRNAAGAGDASMVSAVYGDGRRSDALDNSLVQQSAGAEAGMSVDGAPINMWDYKSFVGHSIVPTKIGFKLERRNGWRFLTNNSGQSLSNAAWIENGRVHSLGNLAAGARVAVPLEGSKAGSASNGLNTLAEMAAPVYNFDNAGTGRGIASAALALANVDTSRHSDGVYPPPTLVAWQSRPSASLSIAGEAPVGEAVSMWLWRFTK